MLFTGGPRSFNNGHNTLKKKTQKLKHSTEGITTSNTISWAGVVRTHAQSEGSQGLIHIRTPTLLTPATGELPLPTNTILISKRTEILNFFF